MVFPQGVSLLTDKSLVADILTSNRRKPRFHGPPLPWKFEARKSTFDATTTTTAFYARNLYVAHNQNMINR